MTTLNILYLGNDMILELDALKNAVTDAFINNATVSVTLTDSAGEDVTGETWPLTMSYVAASDGKYRAVLQDTLPLIKNKRYKATVNAVGSGLKGNWEIDVIAKVRQ
jgi:hypothetical protein